MKFDPRLAPVRIAVLPLVKNNEKIVAKANEIFSEFAGKYNIEYDESGTVGKRYRRQDEIGTPLCVTVDFDTVGEGGRRI